MELKQAVHARRSIRAFKPDAVPEKVLTEIMEEALWVPSWGNTQPWEFVIVGGKTLEKIQGECLDLMQKGVKAAPDLDMPVAFNETQTARYKGLGRGLFKSLGIERGDHEKRELWYQEMTKFFGAPNAIYLHLENGFNQYALMDAGIIMQTIALLAVDSGLGTCFLARSVVYPEVVKKYAGIPGDRVLVMGLAIGYPILDHPVNLFRSERGKSEEFFRWVDIK